MERSKQNKHVVCDKDNNADNGDDSVEKEDDDGVDDGAGGADKHLAHFSQATECCLTERSKQNKRVVCNVDDDVDNGGYNGDDDGAGDGADGADKHLTHLSLIGDCCLTERSKKNEHVVCDKDNNVDNGNDDSNDGADKHLTSHTSQKQC
eukprot:4493416-Ditylum_brightwellii.AAC.1